MFMSFTCRCQRSMWIQLHTFWLAISHCHPLRTMHQDSRSILVPSKGTPLVWNSVKSKRGPTRHTPQKIIASLPIQTHQENRIKKLQPWIQWKLYCFDRFHFRFQIMIVVSLGFDDWHPQQAFPTAQSIVTTSKCCQWQDQGPTGKIDIAHTIRCTWSFCKESGVCKNHNGLAAPSVFSAR